VAITNGYCTLAEMRSQLGLASTDTAEDTYIETIVEVTSREIDRITGQFFYSVGAGSSGGTRYFSSHDGNVVYTAPIQAVTSVNVDDNDNGTWDETWTTTGSSKRYRLRPVNAAADSESYWQMYAVDGSWPTTDAAIKVVADFGWAAIPRAVHEACLIQGSRLFHRRSAPFGIVEGQDAGMMTLRKIDPDVHKLLETYRMPTTVFA
jgi:hypothetical protein